MLIRSQNRKTIVNMENIDTICVVRDEDDSKEIKEHYRSAIRYFNSGEETMGTLAWYSSEEKAIKVLDMITYRNQTIWDVENGFTSGGDNFSSVFQMPQDEDVD